MSLNANPSIAEILDEVDETLPHTFPSSKTLWLGGGAPLVFPTSFANKSRIVIMDTQVLTSPGADINFTGLNVGDVVSNRMLVAAIGVSGTSGGAIGIPAQPQVNGIGATADAAWYTNKSGHSIATCILALDDVTTTGANGSARLQTSGATIAHAVCVMMAVYDTAQTSPHDRGDAGGVANVNVRADSANIAARGQLITACTHYNNEPATVVGATKRFETNIGSARFTLAFDTLMPFEAARPVSFSWSTAAVSGSAFHSRQN